MTTFYKILPTGKQNLSLPINTLEMELKAKSRVFKSDDTKVDSHMADLIYAILWRPYSSRAFLEPNLSKGTWCIGLTKEKA